MSRTIEPETLGRAIADNDLARITAALAKNPALGSMFGKKITEVSANGTEQEYIIDRSYITAERAELLSQAKVMDLLQSKPPALTLKQACEINSTIIQVMAEKGLDYTSASLLQEHQREGLLKGLTQEQVKAEDFHPSTLDAIKKLQGAQNNLAPQEALDQLKGLTDNQLKAFGSLNVDLAKIREQGPDAYTTENLPSIQKRIKAGEDYKELLGLNDEYKIKAIVEFSLTRKQVDEVIDTKPQFKGEVTLKAIEALRVDNENLTTQQAYEMVKGLSIKEQINAVRIGFKREDVITKNAGDLDFEYLRVSQFLVEKGQKGNLNEALDHVLNLMDAKPVGKEIEEIMVDALKTAYPNLNLTDLFSQKKNTTNLTKAIKLPVDGTLGKTLDQAFKDLAKEKGLLLEGTTPAPVAASVVESPYAGVSDLVPAPPAQQQPTQQEEPAYSRPDLVIKVTPPPEEKQPTEKPAEIIQQEEEPKAKSKPTPQAQKAQRIVDREETAEDNHVERMIRGRQQRGTPEPEVEHDDSPKTHRENVMRKRLKDLSGEHTR